MIRVTLVMLGPLFVSVSVCYVEIRTQDALLCYRAMGAIAPVVDFWGLAGWKLPTSIEAL